MAEQRNIFYLNLAAYHHKLCILSNETISVGVWVYWYCDLIKEYQVVQMDPYALFLEIEH